ncbi:LAGLIDADG family homing endonuclease [Bradyrhizobium barranii subsp. barranii]|uniref:LAGLIDADG family homing endonuclease n=1 Tax=Bradyrhizobium barranii subsp. barranii TaxID=2823807 RepID=A0A7Z0Q9V1_9BRAD|nr:LAGLIDADG family homing endonuclease [Bradyrhizobium barranii]UGX93510.1 LAGLIDADG family homing endonuclease [Bradyrhizobium barranii subsp. barranii]
MTGASKRQKAAQAHQPSEAEWQLAQNNFLQREDRRRRAEARWRGAASKRLGPEAYALVELGWAAGFWDGEGHGSASQRGGEFNCSLDQEDRVLLERLQSALGGIGKISKLRRRRSKGGKLQFIYTYRISNQRDLESVWLLIGLHLGPAKRDQFARTLSVPIVTLLRNEKALPKTVTSATVGRRKTLR